MTKFIDGPAAGVVLSLRRAPILLRVVRSPNRNWDALDRLEDEPRPRESIVVYVLNTVPTRMHLNCRPRSASGFYAVAEYRVWPYQPDDSFLRTTDRWAAWSDLVAAEVEQTLPPAVREHLASSRQPRPNIQ